MMLINEVVFKRKHIIHLVQSVWKMYLSHYGNLEEKYKQISEV